MLHTSLAGIVKIRRSLCLRELRYNTDMSLTNYSIGPIEIKLENGDYLYTEVIREGDKLITGTHTNNSFLRDPWEINISDCYGSLQVSLEELYDLIYEDAVYA